MDTIFGLDGITNFKEIDSIDEIVDYYQMKFMDSNFDIELNEPSFKPTYQTESISYKNRRREFKFGFTTSSSK